jgi:hypothetical protein
MKAPDMGLCGPEKRTRDPQKIRRRGKKVGSELKKFYPGLKESRANALL